ncbi:sigma-54 dependent transcriptional regulator [Piscinibacter koreensis]|uniref:sigma-54 dependent transcriptional regulator n=1 Tax=Piscinibacter koreensis TaxID=2742824 RepID=UPI003158B63D
MGTAKKKILCIGTSALTSPIAERLRASDWDVHRANDLRSAHRLIVEHGLRVGLLVMGDVDEPRCAELDTFLGAHAQLEWVGCFDADSLARPCCRDLILAHLFDHHTLPLDIARVLSCVGHAHGRAALRELSTPELDRADAGIVGQSAAIVNLMRQARRIAHASAPVLIHGESGSGKELFAHAIHLNSPRASGPYVPINCGAIQPALIQSELFGHERGSFTGAVSEKRGFFEAADGGTVFLDEIGDLPLDLQVNLLRFLQEGTITRVGSTREVRLDVRIVAATNVDLEKAVAAGRFRQDLYYRLNVLPLHVVPLRDRREDIRLLAEHVFRTYSAEKRPSLKGFSRSALQAMDAYNWPGNVRELINRVRAAMITAERNLIMPSDLGLKMPQDVQLINVLDEARLQAERSAIRSSLQQSGRNVALSARQLGVSRMTLYRLMAKHGIHVPNG